MTIVTKIEFEANLAECLDKVEKTGEEIVVMDGEKPVVKILPVRTSLGPEIVFADVRGKVKYNGDLLEPTVDEWSGI